MNQVLWDTETLGGFVELSYHCVRRNVALIGGSKILGLLAVYGA